MHATPKRSLALAALLACAAAPVAPALAATPSGASRIDVLPGGRAKLMSSPQIREVSGGAGTLRFAATKIRRTASGALDATITRADGTRVGTLRVDGTHGTDVRYAARVSGGIRAGTTYRLTFRLGTSAPVRRTVKAYAD